MKSENIFCLTCNSSTKHFVTFDSETKIEKATCEECESLNRETSMAYLDKTYTAREIVDMLNELDMMKKNKADDHTRYHQINNMNYNQGLSTAQNRIHAELVRRGSK